MTARPRTHDMISAVPISQPPPAPDAEVREVLIVDDSRVQRKILSAQLTRAGYRVTEAGSAEEAIEVCRDRRPGIIISDWMMPGLSGLDLCRAIRGLGGEDYVYFILLTSKTEAGEVATGLDAGADDFLTKPITGEELRARIASGQRLIRMQVQLREKNRLLEQALGSLERIHGAIDRDLVEARKLQLGLVRERQRRFGGSEVHLVLRPSGHVGGDLVGCFPIGDRQVGIYAIDVSGHGITSALMTARLAGLLSAVTADLNIAIVLRDDGQVDALDPADLAALLNRLLLEEMRTEIYFTLAYAVVDLDTGRVALVQAGHPHPAILRRTGAVEFLGQGGLPVGLIAAAGYDTVEARLGPGDRLVFLSDGITEATDPDGRMMDDQTLRQTLGEVARCDGAAFAEALVARVTAFGDGRIADDVSVICLDYRPERAAAP